MIEPQTLYTRIQVAAKLKVSASTVDRLRRAKQIPTVRIGPRSIRFKKADLDNYITRRTR